MFLDGIHGDIVHFREHVRLLVTTRHVYGQIGNFFVGRHELVQVTDCLRFQRIFIKKRRETGYPLNLFFFKNEGRQYFHLFFLEYFYPLNLLTHITSILNDNLYHLKNNLNELFMQHPLVPSLLPLLDQIHDDNRVAVFESQISEVRSCSLCVRLVYVDQN